MNERCIQMKRNQVILAVDDDERTLEMLNRVFTLEGYDITTATSGKSALALLDEHTPDLILLDIMMPQMDGYTVCHRLKANKKTKDIPIVMLTAKGESDAVTKSYNVGADDYIVKPFNPSILLEKVRKWMA